MNQILIYDTKNQKKCPEGAYMLNIGHKKAGSSFPPTNRPEEDFITYKITSPII